MPNNLKTIDELLNTGLIKRGSDPTLVIKRLPTGIQELDNLLGGGVPLGHCIQTYGPESTGKTLISQYIVAAVQKSEHPLCLYLDMECSYDEPWWQQSGVDTEKLLVSSPTTAEAAIDIMRGVCQDESLGMIIVDSVAAMFPAAELDEQRTVQDNNQQPGSQAKVVTRMYHQIVPLLKDRIIFLSTNQMRDTIGGYDELGALPGGRANRHYNHIILRTKREGWLVDSQTKERLGFDMEITSRKNKLAKVGDGQTISLPIMFDTQLDWTMTYIDDALKYNIIAKRGPYFKFGDQSLLGKQALRQFFMDHPVELEDIRAKVETERTRLEQVS